MHAFDRRTDGRTDGQTEFPSLYRDCIPCGAVKTLYEVFSCMLTCRHIASVCCSVENAFSANNNSMIAIVSALYYFTTVMSSAVLIPVMIRPSIGAAVARGRLNVIVRFSSLLLLYHLKLHRLLHPPGRLYSTRCLFVCLSVCLSVSNFTYRQFLRLSACLRKRDRLLLLLFIYEIFIAHKFKQSSSQRRWCSTV